MNDLTIKLKNCPPEVGIMFEAAFKDVPGHFDEPPLEIPADGLEIDFAQIQDVAMAADLVQSIHVFIMASGWIAWQKRDHEK